MKHPKYVTNFSYVDPGVLAGSSHPKRWGTVLQEALASLAEEGIGAIVSLDEFGLDPGVVQQFEMEYLHSPIVDYSVPSPEQARQVIDFIGKCAERNIPTLVHCAAGIGRTGTLLACWFVHLGMDAAAAIDHVRRLRPGSIETYEQEQFIEQFAAQKRREKR